MNWDHQVSSILSAADDSVAKMRERLTSPMNFSKGSPDLFPVRDGCFDPGVDPLLPPPLPPPPPPRAARLRSPSSPASPSLPPGVQWADLAAIQAQLQRQSQAIESLAHKVQRVERERDSQQQRIRLLEEDIHSLRREAAGVGDCAWRRRGPSPGTEQMMEEWRREIGRELSALRGHITRATSLGNLEESFSSQLQGEELQHLRGDVDCLKALMRGQEEDMRAQQSEVRETRRQCECSCKTLEQLSDRSRTHSLDLARTASQQGHTQQEVQQIRVSVSQLREEVCSLALQEQRDTTALLPHTSGSRAPVPQSLRGPEPGGGGRPDPDSDSEDLSPTASLAEISSDDLSWLEDLDPGLPPQKTAIRVRLSTQSRRSDISGPAGDLSDEDDEAHEDDYEEEDDDLGQGSELSLDDL